MNDNLEQPTGIRLPDIKDVTVKMEGRTCHMNGDLDCEMIVTDDLEAGLGAVAKRYGKGRYWLLIAIKRDNNPRTAPHE